MWSISHCMAIFSKSRYDFGSGGFAGCFCVWRRYAQTRSKGALKITDLGESYRERQRQMQQIKMNESEHKAWLKAFEKQQKAKSKSEKTGAKLGQTGVKKPCLYVLDFKGSMDAREVASLREEISNSRCCRPTG